MYANESFDDGLFGGDAAIGAVEGLTQPVFDRFEAGRRVLDALADDLALDAQELDLDALV